MGQLSFMHIVFLGAGNLATNLAIVFHHRGYLIDQVYSRTELSARKLAERVNASFTTDLTRVNKGADLYMICVTDKAIIKVLDGIGWSDELVVHTAGSVGMDILDSYTKNYGVFYPLQTFSKSKIVDITHIPVCIEANNNFSWSILHVLASSVSEKVYKLDSNQRLLLHIAAVFSCNFVNHLYAISEEILKNSGMNFEILYPLIQETTSKIMEATPGEAQTGPAARDDKDTIAKHVSRLANNSTFQKLYWTLSESIKHNKNRA